MHNLPAGAYAALVPVLLSPSLRTSHPLLHRLAGRTLLSLSCLIAAGYALMVYRGLSSAHTDPVGSTLFTTATIQMNVAAVWFLVTAAMALQAAWRRRFITHRAWAVRHLCTGLYVSLHRVLISSMISLPFLGLVQWNTERRRLDGFYASGLVSFGVAVIAAEVAVYQMSLAGQKAVVEKLELKKP